MSNTISIDELIEQEYEQQYFEECKFIWQNFVPKSGQARNLQGELLREIENIRCEAQDTALNTKKRSTFIRRVQTKAKRIVLPVSDFAMKPVM